MNIQEQKEFVTTEMDKKFPLTKGMSPNQRITAIWNSPSTSLPGSAHGSGTFHVQRLVSFISLYWDQIDEIMKKELRKKLMINENENPPRVTWI